MIEITAWPTSGQAYVVEESSAAGEGQGVAWIDILCPPVNAQAIATEIEDLGLAHFRRPMLGHLLAAIGPQEPGAQGVLAYDANTAARLAGGHPVQYLRANALVPAVAPGHRDPPWVYRCPIAFLAHDRWVITGRQRGAAVGRHGELEFVMPYSWDLLADLVRARWNPNIRDGHDLATLLLRGIVESYRGSLAALGTRLSQLEQDYLRALEDPEASSGLSEADYRSAVLDVKWVIDGITSDVAQLRRPFTPPTTAWFRVADHLLETVAREIAGLLEGTWSDLGQLRKEVSAAFALAAATNTSRQLDLSREMQQTALAMQQVSARSEERDRVFGTALTVFASVFLAPGLVVAAFGALPGIFDKNENLRWITLVVSVILVAVATWLVIGALRSRASHRAGSDMQ